MADHCVSTIQVLCVMSCYRLVTQVAVITFLFIACSRPHRGAAERPDKASMFANGRTRL